MFLLANQFAVQSVCASPLWTVQSGYTGAPSTNASGVDVSAAVAAGWQVQLRPRSVVTGFPGRQVVVTVGVLDVTSHYTVTVDGTACTYNATGGDTIALVLAGMASAINSNGTANLIVVAAATSTTLTVTGIGEADWMIGLSTSIGTGTLAGVADPTTATGRFWIYGASGPTSNTPAYRSGQAWTGGLSGLTWDYHGDGNIIGTNWVARLYIELSSVTGAGDVAGAGATITYAAQVVIGPSQQSAT